MINKQTNKLHGLSPRANYADRATAASRRSDCQLLLIKGATWSAWQIPTAIFRFSRQKPLLFYQVAPQLYSRGWVDPVPDPLLVFLPPPPLPENLVMPDHYRYSNLLDHVIVGWYQTLRLLRTLEQSSKACSFLRFSGFHCILWRCVNCWGVRTSSYVRFYSDGIQTKILSSSIRTAALNFFLAEWRPN
jgi:hypothetical protein